MSTPAHFQAPSLYVHDAVSHPGLDLCSAFYHLVLIILFLRMILSVLHLKDKGSYLHFSRGATNDPLSLCCLHQQTWRGRGSAVRIWYFSIYRQWKVQNILSFLVMMLRHGSSVILFALLLVLYVILEVCVERYRFRQPSFFLNQTLLTWIRCYMSDVLLDVSCDIKK